MPGSLAERLRVLRARRGMTLIEAAAQAGVGRDTLSDLERGRRRPSMPTLAKIADGYGVLVDDLLEGLALAGASPKAQASETGPAQSEAPIFPTVHSAARLQLRQDRQASDRAIESTLPQSYFVRHRNEAMKRLLECSRDELAEEYIALMERLVHQEHENGRLEHENGRLREGNRQLRAQNTQLREQSRVRPE